MSAVIEAIYENGVFRPIEPLDIPESTRVSITVEDMPEVDHAWKKQAETALIETWDNDSDEVFNELLER